MIIGRRGGSEEESSRSEHDVDDIEVVGEEDDEEDFDETIALTHPEASNSKAKQGQNKEKQHVTLTTRSSDVNDEEQLKLKNSSEANEEEHLNANEVQQVTLKNGEVAVFKRASIGEEDVEAGIGAATAASANANIAEAAKAAAAKTTTTAKTAKIARVDFSTAPSSMSKLNAIIPGARRQRCPNSLRLVLGCNRRTAILVATALTLPALLGLAVGRSHRKSRVDRSERPSALGGTATTAASSSSSSPSSAAAALSSAPPSSSSSTSSPSSASAAAYPASAATTLGQTAPPSTYPATSHPAAKEDPPPIQDLGQGLTLRTIERGDGATFPKVGEYIYVHYVGKLAGTDIIFDSSRSKAKPLGFPLGRGRMIKGWEAALAYMSLGQRAVLHVPSALAYGNRAHGEIPPNSNLDFDIELLVVEAHAKGLVVEELAPGDGVTFPRARDEVTINFRAYLPNGEKVADTWAQHAPFQFAARIGQVMLGWDLAILQMSVGERALLRIPPYLAFGAAGNGQVPPNATLRFDMRLEKVTPYGADCMIDNCAPPPPAGPAPALTNTLPAPAPLKMDALLEAAATNMPTTSPVEGSAPPNPDDENIFHKPRKPGDVVDFGDGLTLVEVAPGDCTTFPNPGDWVEVHYIGTLSAGGTPFDSSRDRGRPIRFRTGTHRVIQGWDIAIPRMSVGERAILHIPSKLAYGHQGRPKIPANSDLTFDVELMSVKVNGQTKAVPTRPPSTTAAPSTTKAPPPLDCRHTAC